VARGVEHRLVVTGLGMAPEFIFPLVPGGEASPDEERFAAVWMDARRLGRMLGRTGSVTELLLTVQPEGSLPEVVAGVDALLARWGGLGAVGRKDQPSDDVLRGEIAQLRGLATVVPLIFLGVAAFLLNVMLSRIVLLQRGQIAALKAVGYDDRTIALHFLSFAALIALGGTLPALLVGQKLGAAMTGLYARVFGIPRHTHHVDASILAAAVAAGVLPAVVGALGTVLRIVRLPPAQAMQPPVPANYRRSRFERTPLARRLSSTHRMILRELARRPGRALLSTLGLALATGIVVTGRFFVDVVHEITRTQFGAATHEELSVLFDGPRPWRSVRSLAALPGVEDVDAVRSVPVRFRGGNRTRRGVLMGHPDEARLRWPVDTQAHRTRLDADGVVLGKMLARRLGVSAGDTVLVEVLEGERRVVTFRVAGTVDEPFALVGHLRLDVLARALGEAPAVSTALLHVEDGSMRAVQEALVRMPLVQSVTSRPAERRRFQKRMNETVLVMTLVVTLFAVTMAVGVVYNGARIALAQKSRELASLRVLGFTRGEVARLLFGEVAVQVAAALPLGLVLGRWMSRAVVSSTNAERIRFPIVTSDRTQGLAVGVTLLAVLASAAIVRRKLDMLDLVAVLKTRE
jgi:putative ABC transport system permease protein